MVRNMKYICDLIVFKSLPAFRLRPSLILSPNPRINSGERPSPAPPSLSFCTRRRSSLTWSRVSLAQVDQREVSYSTKALAFPPPPDCSA